VAEGVVLGTRERAQQIAFEVLTWLAIELVVFVVGVRWMPLPPVLAVMLSTAIGWLVIVGLRTQRTRLFDHLTPCLQTAALAIFGLSSAVITHGLVANRVELDLWRSLQFGEPPSNRVIMVHRLQPTQAAAERLMVEFGIKLVPIEGFIAALYMPPSAQILRHAGFLGKPGLSDLPVGPEMETLVYSSERGIMVGNTSDRHHLSSDTSFYLILESNSKLTFFDCEISKRSTEVQPRRCSNGGVSVREALAKP